MFISLTDNGGRRVSGDRRLVTQEFSCDERREVEDRRNWELERRASKEAVGNRYERRAMPLFLKSQKNA